MSEEEGGRGEDGSRTILTDGGGGTDDIRATLPDMLIGLGNAGKQVVYEFMETEWILREAIEEREGNSGPDVDAYIVDTDTDDRDSDKARVNQINKKVDALAGKSDVDKDLVNTELTYINLIDSIGNRYTDKVGLTAPARVEEIASGLRAWWLEDDDDLLVDNYSKGVLRRRALSKALFHASDTGTDNPLDPILTGEGDESVAYMVVGLGGGTGSGIFLDIAKKIKEEVGRLYLLGIIPAIGEQTRRRANAHGALSELEYLARTDEDEGPFHNTILMPFGALDNRNSNGQKDEFDEAAANVIVSSLNFDSNDQAQLLSPSHDLPKYAPFTVAVPQTIRFEIGKAETAKDKIDDFVDDKLSELETELKLYDRLDTYIDAHLNNDVSDPLQTAQDGGDVTNNQFNLSETEATELRSRFDRLRYEILEEPIFDALNYEAHDEWKGDIDSQLGEVPDDLEGAARDERTVLEASLQAETLNQTPEQRYQREDKDEELDRFVRRELLAIRARANLKRARSLVDDDAIDSGLDNAMQSDNTTVPAELRQSESDARERRNDLEVKKEAVEAVAAEMQGEGVLEREGKAWKADVQSTVEKILAIRHEGDEVQNLLKNLEGAIDDAIQAIDDADRTNELREQDMPDIFGFDEFDDLNEKLADVGMEEEQIEKSDIRPSIDALREAKRIKLNAKGMSIGQKLVSLVPLITVETEGGGEYEAELNSVDDNLFNYQDDFGESFYCRFTAKGEFTNKADMLDGTLDEHVKAVAGALEDRLADLSFDREWFLEKVDAEWEADGEPDISWPGDVDKHVDDLKTELKTTDADDASDLLDALLQSEDEGGLGNTDAGVSHRILEAGIFGPVDDLESQLEDAFEEANEMYERYHELLDIIGEEGESYEEGQRRPNINFDTTTTNGNYVSRISASDSDRLVNRSDMVDAELHLDEAEKLENQITNNFRDNANDVRLPLKEREIKINRDVTEGTEDTIYEHVAVQAFMGRAFGERDPEEYGAEDVEETLDGLLSLRPDDNGYASATVPYGAPWDISLVTFVGGIFLDNLAPVQNSSKGYHLAHEEQREKLAQSIRVRHTHGLDGLDKSLTPDTGKGAFVYRDPLIDLDDPTERSAFVDATEEERMEIFERKTESEDFESTVDLNDSS
ncbi:tubulin-like doman-containing protein [Haloplanus rubicundus]|uniref:Tubulin like n=1 Tax=Haloplanus rubicundus TaxID=1547898 RepID=A0A345E851_9EURY|nr:tubulin-like doman-containing protein [Haloplanus rubicundus]AXG08373.1 hypothetical protein DU484_00060 [Haloplanus rubicundus]